MGALPLKIFPQALKISRGVILGLSWAVVMCVRCSGGVPGCFLAETEPLTFFQKIQNEQLLGRSRGARLLTHPRFPGRFSWPWSPLHAKTRTAEPRRFPL